MNNEQDVNNDEQMSELQAEVPSVSQFQDLFNKEFISTLSTFVNELDIAFESIEKPVIKNLRNYIKKLETDDDFLLNEMNIYADAMTEYQEDLHAIVFTNKKIKTEQLKFLDNIVLFDGNLDFKVFSTENKNTKISIIKHLNTMYMSCAINMLNNESPDLSMDQLLEKTTEFIKELTVREEPPAKSKSTGRKQRRPQSKNGLPDLAGMGDLMGSLIGNTDIMNLAMDLSKNIQSQNINPMNLVSSLLSGKPDPKINNLINSVSSKIERKIESGEIDKDRIEQQVNNIMSNIDTSELMSKLANSGLMNKMASKRK